MEVDDEGGHREFGSDVDAAIQYWGGYADNPAGIDITHRVLAMLGRRLGTVERCWVPPSKRHVRVQLAGLDQVALDLEPGRVYIRPAAVKTETIAGVDLVDDSSVAHLSAELSWEGGLNVWNPEGARDRAPANSRPIVSRLRCATPGCTGNFTPQPGVECGYCGAPLGV